MWDAGTYRWRINWLSHHTGSTMPVLKEKGFLKECTNINRLSKKVPYRKNSQCPCAVRVENPNRKFLDTLRASICYLLTDRKGKVGSLLGKSDVTFYLLFLYLHNGIPNLNQSQVTSQTGRQFITCRQQS